MQSPECKHSVVLSIWVINVVKPAYIWQAVMVEKRSRKINSKCTDPSDLTISIFRANRVHQAKRIDFFLEYKSNCGFR
jgi:hypothetical protein